MPPVVFLVRHETTALNSDPQGERVRGWVDHPLTAEGKAGAVKIGKDFAPLKGQIQQILTSDFQRCALVAKEIATTTGAPVKETIQLRPWRLGAYQGRRTSEVTPELNRLSISAPDQAVLGGESYNAFLRRFLPIFKMALDAAKNDNAVLVLVTHTRNLRAADGWMRAGMKGLTIDPAVIRNPQHMDPGEVRALVWNGKAWQTWDDPLKNYRAPKARPA